PAGRLPATGCGPSATPSRARVPVRRIVRWRQRGVKRPGADAPLPRDRERFMLSPMTARPVATVRDPARDGPDESSLLAGLRSGEGWAYEALVRAFGGRLLLVARRFLRNEDDARDALQDAFLSAFRGIDRFAGEARLSTWLNRIVINAALMKLRKRQRQPERPIDELLPQFLEDGHRAHPTAGWRATPADDAQRQETLALVRDAIDQLPDTYRTVLLLRDIEELDTGECARLLGVTVGVVKTRLHRARQALRTLLDPHFRGGAA